MSWCVARSLASRQKSSTEKLSLVCRRLIGDRGLADLAGTAEKTVVSGVKGQAIALLRSGFVTQAGSRENILKRADCVLTNEVHQGVLADARGREWRSSFLGVRRFAAQEAGSKGEAAQKVLTESSGAAEGSRRGFRRGPVSWGSLALLILTGAGLLYYFDNEKRRRMEVVKQGPAVGKAAIGGPFSLVDHEGRPVTEQDLKGPWSVLYFGFTYCPDICPDELQKLATAVDLIEKKGGPQIRPVFISIDPERDTVEQVALYVKEFHPRLLGLTGGVDAVRQAAREYRVYFMKTEEEGDDYLVDHSIIMYLMDPNMEFVKFFGKNYTAEGLAEGILEEVKNRNTNK